MPEKDPYTICRQWWHISTWASAVWSRPSWPAYRHNYYLRIWAGMEHSISYKNECVPSKGSDQPGQMHRLIWVFAGSTCKLVEIAVALAHMLRSPLQDCTSLQADLGLCFLLWHEGPFWHCAWVYLEHNLTYRMPCIVELLGTLTSICSSSQREFQPFRVGS